MDEHEKFFFDLNGYLVVENALTPDEIAACNKAIDNNPDRMRIRPPEQSLSGESKTLKGKHGRTDLGGMLTWPKPWCQPFRDLLAHPTSYPTSRNYCAKTAVSTTSMASSWKKEPKAMSYTAGHG